MTSKTQLAKAGRSRAIKTFGRRRGKRIRDSQQLALEELLASKAIDASSNISLGSLGFPQTVRKLRMEIGFGSGEHLTHAAEYYADTGFIGCEPFLNGVAALAKSLSEKHLDNIRVHAGDASEVMAALPSDSLDTVYVLYPDPWPKRRQRKRRIISEENLIALARIIRPGGELLFVSDINDYCAWTLARIKESDHFDWSPSVAQDWTQPWPNWISTRYEIKARREGRASAYLRFIRNRTMLFSRP